MKFEPAPLEDWMRLYYFAVDDDIGSSGVEDYSLADLRALLGIGADELDAVVFRDSTSFGGEEVRTAIARQWGTGDPDKVMVTHGGSEAIYLVLSTLLEPTDSVVVTEPTYHTHTSIARTMGCDLRVWPLRPENGFRPDLDDLRAVIDGAKAVVVNFPHNPTGASLTPEQRDEFVEICREAGAYLVWDQAFREMVVEGEPLVDPVHDYDKAVSIGTLSKGYGLPGLRVGWAIGPEDVLRGTLDLRDRMTLHLSPLVELLATRVAQNADLLVGPRMDNARRNLALLRKWAAEHPDLIDLPEPMGGASTFPQLLGHADTTDFCHELARQHRTLLVPGTCFGDPTRVRLGYGGPAASFARGLETLALVGEKARVQN
ncbi:capreomycidine synthase [Lentzea sp. NPDC058436]|uniref:capreomycidine synthase n=1 Tax=Lentzea sp. NPDC058436 TaxID=3346499 RepID=UPI0036519F6E